MKVGSSWARRPSAMPIFSWNVPKSEGGSLEFVKRGADGYDENILVHMLAMTNELMRPFSLHCPADSKTSLADAWTDLRATNISYRLCTGSDVDESHPGNIIMACPIHHRALYCDGSVIYASYNGMTNKPPR